MERGQISGKRSHAGWIAVGAAAVVIAALLWLVSGPSTERPRGFVSTAATLLVAVLFALVVALAAAGWMRQRRATAELLESRQQLQALVDVLDVWHWHSDERHALKLLRPPHGAAPAAWSLGLAGRPLWEAFPGQDVAGLRARLESPAPLDDVEVQHRSAPGEATVAVRLRGRVRNDAQGRFAGYVGTLRETPPASAAVPALASAGAAGAAAAGTPVPTGPGAIDSMPVSLENDHESFSYTVSHDLRAPIRVVEGFTRILKEDYGRLLDRIGNDHLERVLGAAARMNAMIDALLALSKLSSQPIAHQPVNLSQLAGFVVEDLRRQSPQREVRVHIAPGLQVMGDPTLLRVVLENLLGNAWKYTGKRPDAQIWFERSGQENAMFSVRDNGAGFDMRFADRLFGVFQRLHSANDFQGTGVGLASVRRIVRRLGGEIWAEAEVGHGASFHFSLAPTAPRA
jgi:signal transduction histidine kinase